MAAILVTPAQLQALSARTAGSSDAIAGELAGLRAALAPLGSDWAGQAALAFTTLIDDWARGADSLQQALTGIATLLSRAGGAYAQAEAQIASSFAG